MCYISLGEEGNRAAAAAAYLFFSFILHPRAVSFTNG